MNDAISAFHFIRPWAFVLIPIAGAVAWWWKTSSDPLRGWRTQIDSDLLSALTSDGSTANDAWWKRESNLVFLSAGWLLAVVAIAGPTWKVEANPFAQDAQPLVILLKADESMASTALTTPPLERAKLKIADLASVRKGDPLGLVAYSGSAHAVLPPTEDTTVVAEMAAEINPSIMPKSGDALDQAILEAGRLLENHDGATILVMADQANLDAKQVIDAHQSIGAPAIEFLSLLPEESQETQSLQSLADSLRGQRVPLTVDDRDIQSIIQFAERRSSTGLAGKSDRWQEAGYWLSPVLACMVAMSFRREKSERQEPAK
ncbi:vWA domain-containing protein [Rhodopirellula halodulae]|uniref:vWA domain-containing protein n=1 Tax=Rhodopirellula halodulae TaxID=2894198 RepID=UPI001E305ABA|nr:VWA domain-containing protein [Rhodopirellula sp. JC737]MCC9656783.1 VWA domain-containing protein [Rhodopirellula sp. JC737]